MPQTQTVMVY